MEKLEEQLIMIAKCLPEAPFKKTVENITASAITELFALRAENQQLKECFETAQAEADFQIDKVVALRAEVERLRDALTPSYVEPAEDGRDLVMTEAVKNHVFALRAERDELKKTVADITAMNQSWERNYNEVKAENADLSARVDRGSEETELFRLEMLRVLNAPRNAAKHHWSEMTTEALWAKFHEEMVEVFEAVENETPERQAAELVDLANMAMMLHGRLTGQRREA